MFPGDVIGGFRRSLCFWAISGVFYAVHCIISKG